MATVAATKTESVVMRKIEVWCENCGKRCHPEYFYTLLLKQEFPVSGGSPYTELNVDVCSRKCASEIIQRLG